MSLTTRCPACKTLFKVVPDQLRISEGWVRCGQCNEIFDASTELQGSEADAAQPASIKPPETAAPAAQASAPVDLELADDHPITESLLQEAVSSSSAWPDGMANESGTQEVVPRAEAEPAAQELSFMRSAKPVSRWHRPLVRAGLVLISLLLCLGLALQLLVQERDRVAAVEPGLKPLIEEVCAFMECTVEPLRQIDSVVIDSSSFNKIRGDVYRLNFTLKNTATTELALPAIELSLTDVHDQPLLRRVFLPDELGLKSDVLSAAAESQASLTLGIKTNGGADRVAGYRILAFYP
jgi:predicted Zn finger-like uncharacterized protein